MLPKSTSPPKALLDVATGAAGLAGVVSGISLKKSKASVGLVGAGAGAVAAGAGAAAGALKKSLPEAAGAAGCEGADVVKKSAPEGAGAAGAGSTAFSAGIVVFTQATPPKLKRASASFVALVTFGLAGLGAATGAGTGSGSGSGATSSSVSSRSRKLRRGVGRCSTGAEVVTPETVEETEAAAEDTTPPTL